MKKMIKTLLTLNSEAGHVTEWIQLTLKGEFTAVDGRGPFIADEVAILQAAEGQKLAVDINHSIDLKGSQGEPSPAVGWIVELQSRDDGIYGRVEWTEAGKECLANKEYGSISPVLVSTDSKPLRVLKIARASLCNDPGLPQLKALFNRNGETAMDKELRAALGLPEDADEKAVLAAVKTNHSTATNHAALMTRLRTAVGVDAKANEDIVVTTFQSKIDEKQADKSDLEQQVTTLNTELMQVKNERASEKAETFVTSAIADFRISPTLKDHFIARHMKEPAAVEKEISAMPALMSAGLKNYQPEENKNGLSHEDQMVCDLMGVDPEEFSKTKKKELL